MPKKLLKFLLVAVILFGGLYLFLWLAPIDWNVGINAEEAKLTGNYEGMKSDLESTLAIRATAATTIANFFFEQIGIERYDGIENRGLKGNVTIYADDNEFDCVIMGGELRAAYIGNVRVYSSSTSSSGSVANIVDYTYSAYKVFVRSFSNSFDVPMEIGADMYNDLTSMGILSLTGISEGKLDGVQGYYANEGMLQYFIKLNESHTGFASITVISDYFGNMEVYNAFAEAPYSLSDVRVMSGARIGLSTVMSYKVSTFTDAGTVSFPTALESGDDAWLMIRKGDQVYLEVIGDVTKEEKTRSYKFVMVVEGAEYQLVYAKMGRKELQVTSP